MKTWYLTMFSPPYSVPIRFVVVAENEKQIIEKYKRDGKIICIELKGGKIK